MKIRTFFLPWPLLLGLLLAACARPIPPEGGQKDTAPPKVDSLRSTRNYATRSNPRRIQLVFDEWIVLKDAANQLVVSPPLAKRPEVLLRGRTVSVVFDKKEVLRPNTTYTLNFGTAVQDLHEGNPAKDLRFVFSTGDFIDSLSVRGSVADAFTGELVTKVAVMLYENLVDSALQKERPYYFTRVDQGGKFVIPNVKAGVFRLVAVEELRDNLRWDPSAGERIGFSDTLVQTDDTAQIAYVLKLFRDVPRQRLTTRETSRYGRLRLTFAAPPDSVVLRADTAGIRLLTEREADTLFVWYDRADSVGAWNLLVDADTVAVRPDRSGSREDFLKNHRVLWVDAPAAPRRRANQPPPQASGLPPKTVSISPFQAAVLPFNTPPAAFDTARWVLLADSVPVHNFAVTPDSAGPRNLVLQLAWKPGTTYRLKLLPGAITDFFGVANADTLSRNLLIWSEKQLGALSLTLQNLRPGGQYLVQLLENERLESERVFVAPAAGQVLTFTNLPALTYTVRVIEDRDANGRWDSGSFAARRQAEPVFVRKLEALRANWEVKVEMVLDEKQQ